MITLEIGKPITESRMEVEKCVWVLKYFAENAEEFLKQESIKTGYKESYIQYDPLGVILGIMPWNFPFWQVFRFAIPALLSGNTVLLKHASNVSGVTTVLNDIFNKRYKYPNILYNCMPILFYFSFRITYFK